MSNEAIPKTNTAVISKIRTIATEIGQAANQFIDLTSDQIAAYISKMVRLLTAEHNRYDQRPLSTTLLAGNQKPTKSLQQENRTVSESAMQKVAGFAKKAKQSQSCIQIGSLEQICYHLLGEIEGYKGAKLFSKESQRDSLLIRGT